MIVGIERLLSDLKELGHENVNSISDGHGMQYALIQGYCIPAGTFEGKTIDLAIPSPTDFPRSSPASIHIRSNPHLVPMANTGSRNVITSNLGPDWQYWSYRFHPRPENPTTELLSQINEVFRTN